MCLPISLLGRIRSGLEAGVVIMIFNSDELLPGLGAHIQTFIRHLVKHFPIWSMWRSQWTAFHRPDCDKSTPVSHLN